jgi:hypothetical protein
MLSRTAAIRMLELAIEHSPDHPALYERLGQCLMRQGKFPEAIVAFRRSADSEPGDFGSWGSLAQSHVEVGDFAQALEVCNQGERYCRSAGVAKARGEAMEKLGHPSGAIFHLRQAFEDNPADELALESLFRCLSREPDATALWEFCEALPATPSFQSRRLAFRAIALSRLGRHEEARDLVDVQRHVKCFRFEPSPSHADAAAFNAQLAIWLTAHTGAIPTPRPDCVIDHELTRMKEPLMMELRSFLRRSFSSYIADLPAMGLGDHISRPEAGELFDFVVFLRGNGRNGEHIHANAYVIGVYYVQVPTDILAATDTRGCLVLGTCEKLTAGHQPAWGTRLIRPEPGTLVIFPAHMFHDVIPTQSAEPRIVVGADVRPVAS